MQYGNREWFVALREVSFCDPQPWHGATRNEKSIERSIRMFHSFSRFVSGKEGQQTSPLTPCRPSFATMGTMIRAPIGSAHHHPATAFRTSPANKIKER